MNDTEKLAKKLSEALDRIEDLEKDVAAMRQNTNTGINGHTAILERLVVHTNYRPPQGEQILFVRNFDVGR